jgi:hypothetical protein
MFIDRGIWPELAGEPDMPAIAAEQTSTDPWNLL